MVYYELPEGIETLDDDAVAEYKIIDNDLKIINQNNDEILIKPIWEEVNDYDTSDWDIMDDEGCTTDVGEFIEVFNFIQEKKKTMGNKDLDEDEEETFSINRSIMSGFYARFTKEIMVYYELPEGIEALDDDCIAEYKILDNDLKIIKQDNEEILIKPIWEEVNDYDTSDWDMVDAEGYTTDVREFIEVFNFIQEKKKNMGNKDLDEDEE